ncbi:uncharacterized protein CDAR_297281 [Caerostris darwini]|uniref:Uncharacterized protein n=1 Tax=Caerostris darwini TaxID=1538125 RepID=A0AAV4PTC1_9ARAC|nr:uncharacterized protein CDAR_297281 [Caerostris darwini]
MELVKLNNAEIYIIDLVLHRFEHTNRYRRQFDLSSIYLLKFEIASAIKEGRCQVPLFVSSGPDTNFNEHPFRCPTQRCNPVRKKLPDRKFHSGRLGL